MNRYFLNHLFFFLLLTFSLRANAHWEPRQSSDRMKINNGNMVIANQGSYTTEPSGAIKMQDWLFYKFVAIPSLSSDVKERTILTTYTMGLFDSSYVHHEYCEIEVELWVEQEDILGAKTHFLITRADSFKIKFDPLSGRIDYPTITVQRGASLKTSFFVNAIYYREIVSGSLNNPSPITSTGSMSDLPKNFFIEASIEVDRIYNLDGPNFSGNMNSDVASVVDSLYMAFDVNTRLWAFKLDGAAAICNGSLPFTWTNLIQTGFNNYEVEWTFVDVSLVDASNPTAQIIPISFTNNATRVPVNGNQYAIPAIYPAGFIVARVRGVYDDFYSTQRRHYTNWSLPDELSMIYDPGAPIEDSYRVDAVGMGSVEIFCIVYVDNYEQSFNWDHAVAFAEEGKRKQVISYYDGSLRNRQSTTLLSTEEVPIVGEVVYDYLGRPAVQPLPAPMLDGDGICFRPKVNVSTVTGDPYSWLDFDIDHDACDQTMTGQMDNTMGASEYYSSANQTSTTTEADLTMTQQDMSAFIPDAQGYPFTQVEFMPDGTGRLRRQGGIGLMHQLYGVDQGESALPGREIRYFYAYPTQPELDRLFGNEVGLDSAYKKNYVKDQNGQVSVSYADPAGRTIATALVGDPELITNLDPLPGAAEAVQTMHADIHNTHMDFADGELKAVFEHYVSAAGNYEFSYSMTSPMLVVSDLCDNALCFDCIYDLTLSIKDECGEELIPGGAETHTIGTLDYTCGEDSINFALSPNPLVVNLGVGMVRVEKTLTINKLAFGVYKQKFIEELDDCIPTLTELYTEERALLDDDCIDEPCEDCESFLATQFANEEITELEYDYEMTQCRELCTPTPCTNLLRNMMQDMSPGGQYFDNLDPYEPGVTEPDDQTPDYTLLNTLVDGTEKTAFFTAINTAFGTSYSDWDDIRNNFREEYGFLLAAHHPEYCMYEKCLGIEATYYFDMEMLASPNGTAARADGYFNPIGSNTATTDFPVPTVKDPFFVNGGGTPIRYYYEMADGLENWDPATPGKSLWEVLADFRFSGDVSAMPGDISCPSRYDFQLFYAGYQTTKHYWLAHYYDSITTNVCSTDLLGKPARFIYNMQEELDNAPNYDVAWGTMQSNIETEMTANCEDNCEGYADAWMQALAPCELSPTHSDMLREELIAICVNSCGSLNQVGEMVSVIPTANNNRSFEDALDWIMAIGSYTPSKECNAGVIHFPATTAINDFSTLSKPLDDCACDKIGQLTADYEDHVMNATLPTGVCSEGDYFKYIYGFDLNLGLLKCACAHKDDPGNMPGECETYIALLQAEACSTKTKQKVREIEILLKHLIEDGLLLTNGTNLLTQYPEFFTEEWALFNETDMPCTTSVLTYTMTHGVLFPGGEPELIVTLTNGCGWTCSFSLTFTEYNPSFTDFNDVQFITFTHLIPNAGEVLVDVSDPSLESPLPIVKLAGDCFTVPCGSVEYEFPAVQIPYQLDCISCIECEDLATYWGGFEAANSGFTFSKGDVADVNLFHNYLVKKEKLNLPFDQLYAVLNNCANDSYCPANSLGSLYVALFKRMIFHNELTEASLPLDNSDYGPAFAALFNGGFDDCSPRIEYVSSTEYTLENNCGFSCTITLSAPLNATMVLDNAIALSASPTTLKITTDLAQTSFLEITSSCHVFAECEETPLTQICPPEEPEELDPCVLINDELAYANALRRYRQGREEAIREFEKKYYQKCMEAFEQFSVEYDLWEYHYTLYYYDQAGNLIKTVPPAGVNPITSPSTLAQVKAHRKDAGNPAVNPTHSLITNYSYNTINQVSEQITPDGGTSHFWYDYLGRITVSQNARQATDNLYSYSRYDGLGRAIESGQIEFPTGISPSEAADPSFLAGLLTTNEASKTEILYTHYDEPLVNSVSIGGFGQENLRNRIASTTFQSVYDADPLVYAHATHYSYDIHGNVKQVLTDRPVMELYGNRFKKMEYRYDLISGTTSLVMYQPGEIDQWFHYYRYDADNRLIETHTSSQFDADLLRGFTLPNLSENPFWKEDMEYEYYLHGPLARMNYGNPVVQGLDHAYTVNGWFKTLNSSALKPAKDMGKDGHTSGLNKWIPIDVFALELQYYDGDYTYINGQSVADPIASRNALSHLSLNTRDLYNGNIAQMHVSIPDAASLESGSFVNATLGKTYNYDQLNRITASLNCGDLDLGAFDWPVAAGSTPEQYQTGYTYDANGNILSLFRNGVDGNLPMDDLVYHYIANTNQLEYVTENQTDAYNYPDDLEDQATGNYTYDAVGNLIADVNEEIDEIEWTVNGKIKRITRAVTSTKSDLEFEYNETGQRIQKTEYHKVEEERLVSRTMYALDPTGNPMAIYQLNTWLENDVFYDTLYLDEKIIYGSNRIGLEKMARPLVTRQYELDGVDIINEVIAIYSLKEEFSTLSAIEQQYVRENWRHYRGKKRYELSNHLGNVCAVVTDRKQPHQLDVDNIADYFEPDVYMLYDYDPFGALLPGRFYINNGCVHVPQPPVEILLEEDDLNDRLSNAPAVGTWYSSNEGNIHTSFNEDCQCFEVNANSSSGYVYTTVVPVNGRRNQVRVWVKPGNMSKANFVLVDVTNNRVLASRDVELWDPQIEYTVELEYTPPTGVSPTLELRIYPVGGLSYSEMYIREVSWHRMTNASFTNTLTHTYTATVSGWTGGPGVTVTNGAGNNVVKMTSTGVSSAQVTVGVTAGELNVVRMDLNLFMEPSAEVEILDATTNQVLYREKIINTGTSAHTLDFGIYPANANVIVKVHIAAATGLAGIEVDNLNVENPTPAKTNKYNETFASATVGAWTGTGTLTYSAPCGCLQTQTTANSQYAEVQVSGLTNSRQHYLGMDLYTDGHAVIQVDVYETTSGRILASRLLKGTNVPNRLTMTFNPAGTVRVRAKRLTATGTVTFRIDNVQIGDHGHTLSSAGSLSMLNTVDFSEWSPTSGTADFKVYLHGDQQMEVRNHSASYISRTFTTVAGEAHELTFNLDRRGSVSGSVAVVVINPATSGTLTSQMVGSAGVTAVNLSFTPPGTSIELRLYSLNEYTLIDDIHLHWDRIVIHTICDNSRDYRYGFNGQEKDNEKAGLGNTATYLFRVHDVRLGRFLSVDPLVADYPFYSSYAFCGNRVIDCRELEGKEPIPSIFGYTPMDFGAYVADLSLSGDRITNGIGNMGQAVSGTGDYVSYMPTESSNNVRFSQFGTGHSDWSGGVGVRLNTACVFLGMVPGLDMAVDFPGLMYNAREGNYITASMYGVGLFMPFVRGGYAKSAIGYVPNRFGSSSYDGVRAASRHLQQQGVPRPIRKQVLQSFEVETISLRTADNTTFGLRFYDNINAKPEGRYLFPTFTNYTNRTGLALTPRFNQMSGIAQFQVKPGSTYIYGRAGSQGGTYKGGSFQLVVPNLNNLKRLN